MQFLPSINPNRKLEMLLKSITFLRKHILFEGFLHSAKINNGNQQASKLDPFD